MSDPVVSPPIQRPASHSRRGQALVEFGLVLPLLLVLFLGIADLGRVFQAGIVTEAAARNAAEIVAEEYRRNPPGLSLSDPAPIPADPAFYQSLHDLGSSTLCSEMRSLPSTRYDAVTRSCHVTDADPATHDWMPVALICIHDGADPLCEEPLFGAVIPDPECSKLLAPISPAMEGGSEVSRYVEVRVCYVFTTLVHLPIISFGDIWLQKDRAFTVADYPVPTPSIPPEPSAPPPTDLPSEEPSPSASPSESPSESPTESATPTPTPSEAATPTPEPTPEPTPVSTPSQEVPAP